MMNGNEEQSQPDLVVSNAGPLISLSTVKRLDLLRALFGRIAIPQAVYDKVVVHGGGERGSREVAEADWIEIQHVKDLLSAPAVSVLHPVATRVRSILYTPFAR